MFVMSGYGLGRAFMVATSPLLAKGRTIADLEPMFFQYDPHWHRLHTMALVVLAILVIRL